MPANSSDKILGLGRPDKTHSKPENQTRQLGPIPNLTPQISSPETLIAPTKPDPRFSIKLLFLHDEFIGSNIS